MFQSVPWGIPGVSGHSEVFQGVPGSWQGHSRRFQWLPERFVGDFSDCRGAPGGAGRSRTAS